MPGNNLPGPTQPGMPELAPRSLSRLPHSWLHSRIARRLKTAGAWRHELFIALGTLGLIQLLISVDAAILADLSLWVVLPVFLIYALCARLALRLASSYLHAVRKALASSDLAVQLAMGLIELPRRNPLFPPPEANIETVALQLTGRLQRHIDLPRYWPSPAMSALYYALLTAGLYAAWQMLFWPRLAKDLPLEPWYLINFAPYLLPALLAAYRKRVHAFGLAGYLAARMG